LILAVIAAILRTALDWSGLLRLAARAFSAFRPAEKLQILTGLVFLRELLNQFDEIHVVRF
jgi:hypothetical protein